MQHTDSIFNRGTGEYLELEAFTDEIQQMHGEGKVMFARTKRGEMVIEDWKGGIHRNVLIGEDK